jgi:hypothetical protein
VPAPAPLDQHRLAPQLAGGDRGVVLAGLLGQGSATSSAQGSPTLQPALYRRAVGALTLLGLGARSSELRAIRVRDINDATVAVDRALTAPAMVSCDEDSAPAAETSAQAGYPDIDSVGREAGHSGVDGTCAATAEVAWRAPGASPV